MNTRSQQNPRIAAPAGILLIAASLLISSCSTNTVCLDAGGIAIEPYANVTAEVDFETGSVVLPLDAIDKNAFEVDELRREAWRVLTDSCLSESGLPGYNWVETVPSQEDRLFGLWSVSLAHEYGFERADTVDQVKRVTPNDDEMRCLDSAKEEIRTSFNLDDGYSFDSQVGSAAYDAALASAEGKAAIAAAEACMVEERLELDAESIGAKFNYEEAGNSAENTRIAVIVATCNTETGAIQTLYDLTARYQSALIEQHEAEAEAAAEVVAERIAGFQGIIAASE